MSLNQEEIEHVAQLARIELTDNDKKNMTADLAEIIEYVEELEAAPIENVSDFAQVSGLKNMARKDEIAPGLSVDEVLQNAPAKQENFIETKKVFE